MIPNENSWACSVEVVFRIFDVKVDAYSNPHNELECSSYNPLGEVLSTEHSEGKGHKDAIKGYSTETEIGDDEASGKASGRKAAREHEKNGCETDDKAPEIEDVIYESIHGGVSRFVLSC